MFGKFAKVIEIDVCGKSILLVFRILKCGFLISRIYSNRVTYLLTVVSGCLFAYFLVDRFIFDVQKINTR